MNERVRHEFTRFVPANRGGGGVQFSMDTRGLQRAMNTYATLKNKSDADVVNKAMRFWLPFAANKVKQKTPGAANIRQELQKTAKRVTRGKDKKEVLANTLAAAIVAGRMRKKGRFAYLPSSKDADKIDTGIINEFYEKVRTFIGARVRSANFLRAGFIPGFRQFNVPQRTPSGQIHFKGRSKGIKAKPKLSGVVEAYASNAREGAYKIAPNAFTSTARHVQRQFLIWIKQDINATAKRSGFY
jgi:hypothetical protein